MLSILIPTYNRNIFTLVKALHAQATAIKIIFEIICIDDGSESELNVKNEKINNFKNCTFITNKQNIGRTATRKLLAQRANYKWLLFLDSDVIPKNPNFLKQYIVATSNEYKAVFGGFAYKPQTKPHSLRYIFGKKREEIHASTRNKKPYKIIISANFIILKSFFLKTITISEKNSYGLDYQFGALLKENKTPILHINNEVYHLGLDSNPIFLAKTENAIKTISNLYKSQLIKTHDISILKTYLRIKPFFLNHAMVIFFNLFQHLIKKNLLGRSPNLFLFDVYRLGYFCKITN